MFLIKCLPLNKGLNKDFLSYFSSEEIEKGSLVKINLRGKNTHALVVESGSVKSFKAEIKSASFKLKKIDEISSKPFLRKDYLDATIKTAEYFANSVGSILSQLIPSMILENQNMISSFYKTKKNKKYEEENSVVKMVVQDNKDERMGYYRSLIREEFAKKNSVYICLPQNEDIRQTRELIERGIERYVATFHKEMTKKDFKEEWKKIIDTKHPIVIIAGAKWLFLPRDDIKTIVIDKENSDGWKTITRPFIDLRLFIEKLAEEKKCKLIIGDTFLRIDTLYRHKKGELTRFEQVKWRLDYRDDIFVIDPTNPQKKLKEFRALSSTAIESIRESIENGNNVLVYTTRKGLSPITICNDCGQYVVCKNCNSPMVLYGSKNFNYFKCNQCGEIRDAKETCSKCGSWKLSDLGIGAEKVIKELAEEFPETNIFELNRDIKTTSQKATKLVENFFNDRGSILVGSDMIFSYINKKISTVVVSSLDSLFSIPDFRIREKIFRIMLQARNLSKGPLIIQSRNVGDVSIRCILNGNLTEFYNEEVSDRKLLDYPPFGIFIKIVYRGNANQVKKEMLYMKKIFDNYKELQVTIFNSSHEKKGEQNAINAVFKVARENWPNEEIIEFLRSLPNYYEIKVDPDNLL